MSDLISKAEVEKAIKEYFKMIIKNTDDDVDCALDYSKNLGNAIRGIPTAYDVDKVAEQLKVKSFERYSNDGMGGELVVNFDDVIEILKGGGKDE